MTSFAGRVLRYGWFKPDLVRRLDEQYDARPIPEGAEQAAFLAEHGAGVDVVVCSGRSGVPADLMDALPDLRAVVNHGVGVELTPVDRAAVRGIQVANTPDVLTDCVADTAVAMLLDVRRGISAADRYVRRGAWPTAGNFPLTRRASGTSVGILGLGRIGLAIARRLEGFEMPISYHNRRPRPELPYRYAASPRELAETCEVLVVAATGGTGSDALVDRAVLEALGPEGLLVNIARASIVDEDAMVEMLVAGRLGGAALDVYSREPEVPTALLDLDSVVLLPHLGSGTHETREAMAQLVLDNLDAFLRTGRVLTLVRPHI